MKRALALLVLAACGDDLGSAVEDPDFASSFDGASAVYYGEVATVAPPAPPEPLAGATVCIEGDEACTTTDDDGVYVLTGPGGDAETVLRVEGPDLLAARIATTPSVTGDRSVGFIPMLPEEVIDLRAGDFGVDPRLDERGVVLVLSQYTGGGTLTLAIDDATTAYVGDNGIPDPALTALGNSGIAVFFAVPTGDVLLRATGGRCDAVGDGWPADEAGPIRLPVVAGAITMVHPICTAD